jgi:ribonucleoside-diphosphate reductase alpha chain
MKPKHTITHVIKKSGHQQPFNAQKIAHSIKAAGHDTKEFNSATAKTIFTKVVNQLNQTYATQSVATVDQIRAIVEPTIAAAGYFKTAKYYILFAERKVKKHTKSKLREPILSQTGLEVMKKRYLRVDLDGNVMETPGEMMWRVARHMAKAEIQWAGNGIVDDTAKQFYDRMVNWKFVCAGKAMFEAGNHGGTGQLSSCFVLPIEDSIPSIFRTLGDAAVIHKNNGGTGFNFSKIRPHGDKVKNVPKAASGPVDFIRAYSAALSQILQGAKRQGANIAIVNADHPDIEEFIALKEQDGTIKNFNISVGVTNEFMEAVQANKDWHLINPRNGKITKTIKAKELFNQIADTAWRTGDPGLAFLDRMEQDNPTPTLGQIDATNPCIAGDARISTDKGIIQFKELYKNSLSDTEKYVLNIDDRLNIDHNQSYKALNIQLTGTKPVFQLTTKHGFSIKATADHQFMTDSGWKKLETLTSKDELFIQSNQNALWPTTVSLPGASNKSESDLGEVLGFFVGDGSVRLDDQDAYAYLTFGKDRRELIQHFQTIFSKWHMHFSEREVEGRSIQLWSHNKKVASSLINFGLLPIYSDKKRIPEAIFHQPKKLVKAFLRGLFSADGTVNFVKGKSAYVRLSSKSIDLLKDTQILLLNLGIFSKIYNRIRDPRTNIFPEYQRKDGTTVKYSSDGVLFELEISKDQVTTFLSTIGFIGNLHHEKINKINSITHYAQKWTDPVFEIVSLGEEDVFDLTENVSHSFIANGFVVHNCGEIPLLPYESCNLTSIVLTNHLIETKDQKWTIDWDDLKQSIHLGVRFLDDMIEVNTYALDSIRQMVKEGNRRIGLGVMGFAHLLYRLGIPYDSEEAVRIAERLAKFIRQEAEAASKQLARERGPFGNFDVSVYAGSAETYRNCALLMIAPTGTTSLIANSSSGIEPVFSLVTVRRSFNEDNRKNAPTKEFTLPDPEFERHVRAKYGTKTASEIFIKLANGTDLTDIKAIDAADKKIFTTTHHIKPEWHVKIQAAWQKWIDNSVSKTINFPHTATTSDVKKAYLLGWRLGLKGITIYRDGSKLDQVLNVKGKESQTSKDNQLSTPSTKPGTAEVAVCPECGAAAQVKDGCVSCVQCGWSKCSM